MVKNSADHILKYFSYFSQKIDFDIPCKLSPKETICMGCQNLFSRKNKKNIFQNDICRIFYPRRLRIINLCFVLHMFHTSDMKIFAIS